ncbi:MAG: HD domain-containing protein [Thermoleophilaceae bacterium]
MAPAALDQPQIADLRPGMAIEGVYACTRKDRLTTKAGAPYLALELRDRSGALAGRAFRDADFLAGQFERGELVWVSGRVERFRDELQAELSAIRRSEDEAVAPEAFLPVAYRDLDELDGFLEHLAREEVYDRDYRRLLEAFLLDEAFRAEFRRAPCTRHGHHAYLGGLIEHTVAVGTLATELRTLHPRLNSDLVICAALLHDIGKTRAFALGAEIALSEEGRLLGHVALGNAMVAERAARVGDLPREKMLALAHCILTHHGADAVPGRRFASAEALAVYRLNALDAGVKGALEAGVTRVASSPPRP